MTYFTDNLTREEDEIREEMRKQNAKWGEQNHPDGTGRPEDVNWAKTQRMICQSAAAEGAVTWRHILNEEIAEAYAETDPNLLDEELKQAEAVIRQWRLAIRRRPARATPVRIDSLIPRVAGGEVIAVSHPDWNDGKPVELVELHARFDCDVDVLYGAPGVITCLDATVAPDFLVTPA